jgi:hypothetical protein
MRKRKPEQTSAAKELHDVINGAASNFNVTSPGSIDKIVDTLGHLADNLSVGMPTSKRQPKHKPAHVRRNPSPITGRRVAGA